MQTLVVRMFQAEYKATAEALVCRKGPGVQGGCHRASEGILMCGVIEVTGCSSYWALRALGRHWSLFCVRQEATGGLRAECGILT